MKLIITRADKLANLGKPLDNKDLTDMILDGLDDDYKSLVDVINERELYKKLINKELILN